MLLLHQARRAPSPGHEGLPHRGGGRPVRSVQDSGPGQRRLGPADQEGVLLTSDIYLQNMYLPFYIHQFFNDAKLENGQNLVKSSSSVFEPNETENSKTFLLSPLFIIGTLSVLIIFITYKNWKNNQRSKWLDVVMFAITGIIGILLLLLWFATDHTATAFNYNLLWAFPLNLIILPQLFKTNMGPRGIKYLKFLLIIMALIVFHWIIGVQIFAVAIIPLLLAMAYRYVFLIKYFQTN